MQESKNSTSDYNGKIVVVGSINCDITTYINNFPKAHETIMADRTSVSVGGKGLNQAVAAARAGADVSMVACVGNDQFAQQTLNYLKENKVSVEDVTVIDDVTTGTATILVANNGDNMIVVSPGANAYLTPQLVEKAHATIAEADILIVQLETPLETVEAALKIAKKEGVKTILNPAPANAGAVKFLPYVDIVTPNETEAEVLVGINPDNAETTEKAIQAFHGFSTNGVIITKGENGCSISIDDNRVDIGAFQIDMVDATGAGDVFNGVFAVCVARKLCHEEAARMASAAAAISVTRPMAEGAAPFAWEIEEFLKNNEPSTPR